jgi:ribosome-associated toxin RatA of RatAB toxin-antitoxin module
MKKQEISILNSFQTTQLVLENGVLVWQGNVAFAANVAEINDVVTDIFKYKNIQVTDQGGARVFKQLARELMADDSVKIRSAVQNFASDSKKVNIYKAVNFTLSRLLYGNAQKSLAYASKIGSIAKANEASLAPYKVLPADVTKYLDEVESFKNALPLVDGLTVQRKNATKQIARLIKKGREIVETKLRKGATQFMDTAPDFYNELINSFRIDEMPTHFTEFEMLCVDKLTKENLSGVKVKAVSSKGEMIQFSNPIGEVEFIQFESGYWDLTFELPGYKTAEKKAVKAVPGKKLELGSIELVKI